jgi:putative nucleotidyltransferase with HDIG domain
MDCKSLIEKEPVFTTIAQCAAVLDMPAYVVGGYVRDLLLNRPTKDIDVVCVGSGIELARMVGQQLGGNIPVISFKNFGTAQVKYGNLEIEFVGARKESYRRDSRKPIVEDGTLEDDQKRRDFTINAMAISLNPDQYGQLIDPFEGRKDLQRKMIRTPLDPVVTFSDDPLRMMRAIRFAAQLKFDIDPNAFQAIQEQADRLDIISQERIATELNKIVLSDTPSYGFKLLYHANLLQRFFPELLKLKGVEIIEGHGHKDNFYHTLQVLDNVAKVSDDLWLRWAAILHDIAKPQTKRFDKKVGWTFHNHEEKGARMVKPLFARLKFPLNEHMKFVEKLVRMHLRPIPLVRDNITDSAVRRLMFDAGPDLDALMMLCRADITSKNDQKVKRYLTNLDKLEKRIAELEVSDQLRNFQPVITGEVIMETFGLGPSREVGTLKDAVREAILEGEIKNEFYEAYDFLLKTAEKNGMKPIKVLAKP